MEGGVGRFGFLERRRRGAGAVGEITRGEYGGRISEAVREFGDTPAGANPIGGGGEGDPSGGVEIGECDLFSGGATGVYGVCGEKTIGVTEELGDVDDQYGAVTINPPGGDGGEGEGRSARKKGEISFRK